MALLDDVRVACRVTGSAFDGELNMYIDAALEDMERVGIKDDYLDTATITGIPKAAVICYCKAMLGYDNNEAPRFMENYRQMVCDLLNSSANIADTSDEVDA